MDVEFGLPLIKDEEPKYVDLIRQLIKKAPARCSYSNASLLSLDFYETTYGIHNHNADVNSLDTALKLMELHPAEDNISFSHLNERLQQFSELEVYQTLGLSWKEFIDQPHYVVEMQIKLCRDRMKLKDSVANNTMNEIKNLHK